MKCTKNSKKIRALTMEGFKGQFLVSFLRQELRGTIVGSKVLQSGAPLSSCWLSRDGFSSELLSIET